MDHSGASANRLLAVRLLHEIIEHAVLLTLMLTAPVFQRFCNFIPVVDIVFGLGHELVEHVVDVVPWDRLMTVRVAMGRRVVYGVVGMDIVVRIIDRAEKIWIKGGAGMGEWRPRSISGRFRKGRMRRGTVRKVGAGGE